MRFLVGLGNPGERYAGNRHNIGFMAVDEIVRRYDFGSWRARFQGGVAEGLVEGEKVFVLKPATYMNLSGESVHQALHFFKAEPGDMIVFHDDLDILPGRVKVKRGGGAGGHNGLRSLDRHVGAEYWRVRMGIGHPGDRNRVEGWVLSDFDREDRTWLAPVIESVAARLPLLFADDNAKFASETARDLAFLRETSEPQE